MRMAEWSLGAFLKGGGFEVPVGLVLAVFCITSVHAATDVRWVDAWGASPDSAGPPFSAQTVRQVGDRVSFFVVAGATSDEIYEGYRQLTGVAHMLPKGAYGYIQATAAAVTETE